MGYREPFSHADAVEYRPNSITAYNHIFIYACFHQLEILYKNRTVLDKVSCNYILENKNIFK